VLVVVASLWLSLVFFAGGVARELMGCKSLSKNGNSPVPVSVTLDSIARGQNPAPPPNSDFQTYSEFFLVFILSEFLGNAR
jgi:hypothetical protein